MKYICAECGRFSRVPDGIGGYLPDKPEGDVIDSGQCWKCEFCGHETVVDLNGHRFRQELYAAYDRDRRAQTAADRAGGKPGGAP